MKLSKTYIRAAALALLLPCMAFAAGPAKQGKAANPNRPQIGEPVTPVGINVDLRNLPVVPQWRPGQAMREAHKRQYYPLGTLHPHAPANQRALPDRLPELQQLWDDNLPASALKRVQQARVSINNTSTGVSPGDPVVEVGPGHILYGVNASGGTSFTVYNKTGTKLAGPTAFKSLAPAGDPCATSVSDPIILFDRLANRWFMLEMGGTSSANRLCAYVSKTSDPVSGGWWFYGFATPALPDYPHCGVWNNAYVCTANESGSGAKIYAFDRANMLNGATARPAQRFTSVTKLSGYGFQALTPATFMGTAAPPAGSQQILARHNDDEAHAGTGANGSTDYIDLYSLTIDWTTPANSAVNTLPRIDITEFNSWFRDYSTFATVPQPGSTSRLDPIREVILNSLAYRNFGTHESIVGNFATNQNAARTGTVVDAGIRWFELRRAGAAWSLHQEGTFSPGDASTHHLMGAIASDKNGNIGLGYNVTRTTAPVTYASLQYTGRTPADPLGVMSQGENSIVAGSAAETSGRWGDYYQMVVDPADDCTFWYVGMYRPASSWNTRIQDFKFADCSGGTTTYAISGTIATGAGVGINGVTVSNGGASTTTASNGTWTLANVANGTYTITPSLSGYSFSPASRSVTVNSANVTGQDFTGTATSNANPVANYTFTTSNLTATFTDTSTDSDGTIASRSWNFGDSTTSTATNPSKTYTAAGTYNVALTVTDNGGATNTVTKAVTVTAPPTGNVLSNGVPVNNISGATGSNQYWTLDVPAGATGLKFVTSGGTGDADLYVKFGAQPSSTSYDCKSEGGANAETCNIATAQVGTYHVLVKGYAAFSGMSLTGSYTISNAQTYSNTTDYTISDNTTVDSPITVSGRTGNAPSNASVTVAIVHTYQGDLKVDLVAPDGSLYNIHNRTGSSTDNINKTVTLNLSTEPLNGTWKLRVNDNAAGDVGKIDSWSITF